MELPKHLERILEKDYRSPITPSGYLSEEDILLMLPDVERSIRLIEDSYKTQNNR